MIINGSIESDKIKSNLEDFIKRENISPHLAIVYIGDNPASAIYIKHKMQSAAKIGIEAKLIKLEQTITTEDLIAIINKLNEDEEVNGIIVQMPLPKHIDKDKTVCSISPMKDVDGFHPLNFGKLNLGLYDECLVSCTPMGCLHLINSIVSDIRGLEAVVLGRSIIVGKPMTTLLTNKNASVTNLHSYSKDISFYTKKADIIIACTGMQNLITRDMVDSKAIIIDVGVSRNAEGKIIGDSDFTNLKDYVKAITPPVGGVGPMTVAMLLYNTVKAFCIQHERYADFKREIKGFL